MSFQVQERPITPSERFEQIVGESIMGGIPGGGLALGAGDAISRLMQGQPRAAASAMQSLTNPLNMMMGFMPGSNMLQQLFQMLQQFFTSQNNAGFGDNEQYYQNANGGSAGDPHLSFNGATWDNMGSQPDLLHSDSFQGGYQVSTQTTPPQPNGITYNQSATVTTNYGNTQVSMDKSGNVSISQYGNSFSLQPGQSADLGNGEFVQRNQDGSLQVTCNNGQGGNITTTMRQNGSGVDVNSTANNVDLGGALVSGGGGPVMEPMNHERRWQPEHH